MLRYAITTKVLKPVVGYLGEIEGIKKMHRPASAEPAPAPSCSPRSLLLGSLTPPRLGGAGTRRGTSARSSSSTTSAR